LGGIGNQEAEMIKIRAKVDIKIKNSNIKK
jgi:hypothetical protein